MKSLGLKRLLIMLALPLALAGCGINNLPTKQQQAATAWGEVQNQYQRRSDLIPNLVATVKGYAQHEKGVLVEVTQARAQATHVSVDASTVTDPAKFAQYQQAQNQLSGVLGHLLSITENYPQLQADDNFKMLQSQIEGTENRIAIARRDYNEAVRVYNTEMMTVPGVLWAKTLYSSYKPMQQFAATTEAQTAPKVSFDAPTAPATPAKP